MPGQITRFETHGERVREPWVRCRSDAALRCAFPNLSHGRWDRWDVRHACTAALRCPSPDADVCCRNTDCDYSAAYVTLYTDYELVGHGMTFTIGRGTDIVSDGGLARRCQDKCVGDEQRH